MARLCVICIKGFPSHLPPNTVRWKHHSWPLQARRQAWLYSWLSDMTFFWGGAEYQHCSTCPYVLLKLSLGGVQLKGRTRGLEALLCVSHAEHTGALFTFSLASVLITWCEGKLRATPNFTAKLLEQWCHSEKLTTVPIPNYMQTLAHIYCLGEETDHTLQKVLISSGRNWLHL